MKLLIVMMVVWNLITFSMMGIDKHRAKKDKPRIREKTLIIVSCGVSPQDSEVKI